MRKPAVPLEVGPEGRGEPFQPGRLYYGWVLVGVLALTETVSYGVLLYAFAVVLVPMQAELGWSQALLTGGFSLAALTAGLLAIPVGQWVDRYGPRVVMTAGSVTATVFLLAWARVEHPFAYYLVWAGLGAAMAAVFYEPAFAVVAHWFRHHRGRALTIITLAGGLASTIFVPLTAGLVTLYGWRTAVLWLAAILGALTILPHALLLRRRPADLGLEVDGKRIGNGAPATSPEPERSVRAGVAIRSPSFRWLTVAFFLSTLANVVVSVHLVSLLLDRNNSLAFAGAALATLGLAKLPGRLLLAAAGEGLSTPAATVGVFLVQMVGLLALLLVPGSVGVWIFVALFGAGDGASTPARAGIVADFFGPLEYGHVAGVLAVFLAVARSAAPVGGSLAQVTLGGYPQLLWLLVVVLAVAAGAMAGANRGRELVHTDGKQ